MMATRSHPVSTFQGLDLQEFPISLHQQQILARNPDGAMDPGEWITGVLHMRGLLDVSAFASAVEDVIQKHEVLRTVFSADGEKQIVLPAPAPRMGAGRGTMSLEASREAPLHDAVGGPATPQEGPLFRVELLQHSASESRALVTAHPLVLDAASFPILLFELAQAYTRRFEVAESLAAPALQYPDFTIWQLEGRSDPSYQSQEEYWNEQFGEINLNHAMSGANAGISAVPARLLISAEVRTALEGAASAAQCSLTALFLAVLGRALQGGAADAPVVGVYVDGRSRPSLASLLGPLDNVLPVSLRKDTTADLREADRLLKQAHHNQDVPLWGMFGTAPGKKTSFLDAILVVQSSLHPVYEGNGVTFRWEEVPIPGRKLAPVVCVSPVENGFVVEVWQGSQSHAESAGQLAELFRTELEAFVKSGAWPAIGSDNQEHVDGERMTQEWPSRIDTDAIAQLQAIWRQVLGVDQVLPGDNFFDLGGHSLLAIRIVTRTAAALRLEVPLSALLENPTLGGFAECVESIRVKNSQATIPGEAPAEPETEASPNVSAPVTIEGSRFVFPMSFAQHQMWVINQLDSDVRAYNMAYAWRLRGSLDPVVLRAALDTVVERHSSLRTVFRMVDGEPVQIVQPAHAVSLDVVDLGAIPERMREAKFQEIALTRLEEPIDLESGPVHRFHLIRLGPEEHSLLLTIHHVVFDEASAGVFIRDLVAQYTAHMRPEPEPSSPLPLQYAQFALNERERANRREWRGHIDFWRQQLAGAPASFELPTDRPRRAERSHTGSILFNKFPIDLLERIDRLGREEGATSFMVLLAAFFTVLSRYTGQEDVVIGSPIAGRHRDHADEAIGMFVNTLILRGDLSGNPTFRELMKRVRRTAAEAFDHSEVPFAQLVRELGIDLDISRNPLFQIMFVEQDANTGQLSAPGLQVTPDEIEGARSTKFDLTAYVRRQPDGLRLALEYNSDLFDEATIQRFATHYRTILESATAAPDVDLKHLPLLTAEERQRILVEWNDTAVHYADETVCLHEMISAQAARTPRQVAVSLNGEQLTYAQLEERSNQLANYLRERGVGPEVMVGICLSRSLEMVIGLIGILKAGGAYVPLDPAYPEDRLSFMLEDSGVKLLVTQESLAANWAARNIETICLDSDWEEIATRPALLPDSAIAPDNVAYVIYTSGSTGKPKGVQVTHHNLRNFIGSMIAEPGFTALDTVFSVTTISFDIAGLELYVPLCVGARIELADAETVMDGALLMQRLKESNATVMQATPVTWRMLIDAGWKGKSDLKILCGGEAMPSDLADALLSRCASLWNMYGPTETTIWSTVERIQPNSEAILIGRPIANTQVYVLSPELEPVPQGVLGELYIGGDGLARGYLNRPELTAERFVANPFRAGERMYRTGDLVRFRANGAIEYSGRTDHQVKIRGHRIELGEIEALLRQHPTVRQAVVVVREDIPQSKQLVAYVVGQNYSAPQPRELAQFLGSRLPGYMVPNRFVVLDSLPLTPNGKINRKALPAPVRAVVDEAASVIAPRTATERSLVEIWSEILGVQPIGITENFFELGGHSIEAVKLFARIVTSFGVKLSLNTLLNAPTIEQLAQAIDTPSSNSAPHRLVPIQPKGSRTPLFWIPGGRAISVLAFRDVSMMFGPEQPAYGLESRLPGPGEAFLSVPERAARYIELIRSRQPHGPYQLAGFCMGGMVAFEMAQQLRAQGEQVSLLALLQANVPGYPEGRIKRWRTRNQRRTYQLKTFAQFVLMRMAPDFVGIKRHTKQNILDRLSKLVMGWVGTSAEVPEETQNQNSRAMFPYRPQPYAGSVQVFLAEDCYESAGIRPEFDGRRAWTQLVSGSCDIHVVPGDHHTMLAPPHAKKLADLLGGYMAEGHHPRAV